MGRQCLCQTRQVDFSEITSVRELASSLVRPEMTEPPVYAGGSVISGRGLRLTYPSVNEPPLSVTFDK
jgi:hypothetical protein